MSLQRFVRYAFIGIGNTLVHWLAFLLLHFAFQLAQGPSNLLAFAIAASLSYRVHAHYTFAMPPDRWRYLLFMLGMGALSLSIGALADRSGLSPWLTLMTFSALSLVLGYLYSHTVVFKRRAP
ncbi:GtrA family protein [Pseudomonas xanthosomatis]|uniref:GtrA family protein n=1 Tax=Pseudomonas xanthosomatis TaxID=2842356 RepID=UPI003518207B